VPSENQFGIHHLLSPAPRGSARGGTRVPSVPVQFAQAAQILCNLRGTCSFNPTDPVSIAVDSAPVIPQGCSSPRDSRSPGSAPRPGAPICHVSRTRPTHGRRRCSRSDAPCLAILLAPALANTPARGAPPSLGRVEPRRGEGHVRVADGKTRLLQQARRAPKRRAHARPLPDPLGSGERGLRAPPSLGRVEPKRGEGHASVAAKKTRLL
jgi:hypothetical protein